jgi:Tol biopolymer transport system component
LSPDGSRIAYFFPPADPIFVADKNGANPRQILADKKGFHNHYLHWSPDGRFIYFVRGIPPDDMDVWRIRPSGGEPERLTNHHGRVAYPALLDARTLIYCAAREDGGWGLYAMDVERQIPHAVTSGLEEYTSLSSSADGRRLAATVANPVRNLWTVPITDHVVDESGATRFDLPTVRAAAPRYGPDYVLYLSSKGGAQGLWKWKDGSETELWKGSDGPVPFAPGVSADGAQIAFVTRSEGRHHVSLMAPDGTNVHRIAESLDVVDVPSWSPDGRWIAVIAREEEGRARPLYKVPIDGGSPVRLVDGVNSDPIWSPDGRLILYSEGWGGGGLLRGVTPDKQAVPMPEIAVPYAGNRYRFMPGGRSVVIFLHRLGQTVQPEASYHLLDLATGRTRKLTNLRSDFTTRSFDVSPDGKQILFDRYRDNSDIVLVDLPPR